MSIVVIALALLLSHYPVEISVLYHNHTGAAHPTRGKGDKMKSVLEGRDKKEKLIEYPCLKIAKSGCVVLFTSHGNGVVVHFPNQPYSIGVTKDSWDMPSFEILLGKVILSN